MPQLAIPYLKEAIRIEPYNFDYHSRLAKLYLQMHRISDAEELYQKFVYVPKYQTAAYLGLAACRQTADKPYEAISTLKEGLRQDATSVVLLRELGRTYDSIHEYRKAAEVYQELAIVTPRKAKSAHLLAAQMYEKAGDYSAAAKHYRLVLQIEPRNKQARNALRTLQTNQQVR
jgi:tetratricopeptide (TPR) repeat protein